MSLDLRILDIPGINAVNEAEQAQVARVAERYVATADLILLVGRADDLGFLHPNKLKLAALGDWMLQPNRYRVVLSYTFSPASFKTWFGQDERTLQQVRPSSIRSWAPMTTNRRSRSRDVVPTGVRRLTAKPGRNV